MRCDKYLKVSRLIKRREVAKQMLDAKKITVNGKIAKPATEVKVDDILEITNPSGQVFKVKILQVLEHASIDNAKEMYTNIE